MAHFSLRPWYFSAAVCLVALAGLACEKNLEPRFARGNNPPQAALAADAPVELLEGAAPFLYQAVGVVDSRECEAVTPESRKRMEEDLRILARGAGADAVHLIRVLPLRGRGRIPDSAPPFPNSWKQGQYKHYILRGIAIRKK